jgi:hypothetical protein
MFYNYTKISLGFFMNNANMIDNGKDDKNLIISLQKRSEVFSRTSFIK